MGQEDMRRERECVEVLGRGRMGSKGEGGQVLLCVYTCTHTTHITHAHTNTHTLTHTGYSTVGRMQDVLLGATQDAETIIREWLNGLNFGRQFVALRNHLSSLANKRSNISAAEREVMEVSGRGRGE